jgi:hypothetical protein
MARAALDVNLVLGEAGDDLAESEQRLAERAVAAAWATAAPARSGNPDEHDDRLARACKSSASHHSVPVLVPPTGVAGGFERARRLTASTGCRVIRLCPGGHGYPGSHRFVWGSSEGADAGAARRAIENAEGLGEEDRAAILSGNAQALQDGAYAEAWL